MQRSFSVTLAALVAFATSPSTAETLAETGSWDHGSWRTATMVNADSNRRFCAAETASAFDQVLRVVLYEDADAFLEIRDVTWDYVNGAPLRFNVITDRATSIVTGQGWKGAMTWDLVDADARAKWLDRLAHGGTLDVRMPNRSRVAQFSLADAAPAIAQATQCWEAIQAGGEYRP